MLKETLKALESEPRLPLPRLPLSLSRQLAEKLGLHGGGSSSGGRRRSRSRSQVLVASSHPFARMGSRASDLPHALEQHGTKTLLESLRGSCWSFSVDKCFKPP